MTRTVEQAVHDAHAALDVETHRLGVAYRTALHAAAAEYQEGMLRAQLAFEQQLRDAANALTDTLHDAMQSTPKGV